jgi:hypothetical protein
MKAVQTTWVPATERKPRRVQVRAEGLRRIVPEPDIDGNDIAIHRAAMEPVLVAWWGEEILTRYAWTSGGAPSGNGHVWVGVEK